MLQAEDVAATGNALVLPTGGTGGIRYAKLVAAAAVATAVIREGSGAGRVLARMSAVIGGADELRPPAPIQFAANVHVTLGGAGATFVIYG